MPTAQHRNHVIQVQLDNTYVSTGVCDIDFKVSHLPVTCLRDPPSSGPTLGPLTGARAVGQARAANAKVLSGGGVREFRPAETLLSSCSPPVTHEIGAPDPN